MKLELRSVRINNIGPIDDIKIVDQHLVNLDSAHQIIDGKRILHWIYRDLFLTEYDYLFRLLTKEIKSHSLPDDIVKIVQDRILGSART